MKIKLCSVMVDDQAKAEDFYCRILGFRVKIDMPIGEYRWLTVVAPEAPDGTELLLEPMGFAPAIVYQKELFDAEIPWTAFEVADIHAEYSRMKDLGVVFRSEPIPMGPVTVVVFEDTCGNLIQLVQPGA